MRKNIFKDVDLCEFKDELTILIKHLKKENFSAEALNVKVAFEAIRKTEGRGCNGENECILFLSYSNETTIRIAEENNLNIVLHLISESKKLT